MEFELFVGPSWLELLVAHFGFCLRFCCSGPVGRRPFARRLAGCEARTSACWRAPQILLLGAAMAAAPTVGLQSPLWAPVGPLGAGG